mgnify:CR=1 FL=1
MVSVKHDDISPVQLPVFVKLLEFADVEHVGFDIGAMVFSVVVYGLSYTVGDYQDMEDVYADVVRQLTRSRIRRAQVEAAAEP